MICTNQISYLKLIINGCTNNKIFNLFVLYNYFTILSIFWKKIKFDKISSNKKKIKFKKNNEYYHISKSSKKK